ncbi:ribosomal protein S6 [Venturia nashicola]|uniref:Ribosomal protein S6 n=1 Tax=Venturia nashicola TaxID=86259 RepID=A0A4Z1P4I9_9PEZI|nr:ribosomal protein S6 [Venturia nashicola]TLD29789.1 ribosomal protein S6 [Venturia nashicola]
MLYELIATVRPRSIAEVKEYILRQLFHPSLLLTDDYDSIARTAGKLILTNGGVIRGFTNWGVSALPKPIPNRSAPTSSQATNSQLSSDSALQSNRHTIGHYFIMRFDSSARAQHLLRKTWNADPRLLRFSVVKMAGKFEDICDVGGKAEEWVDISGSEGHIVEEEEMKEEEREKAIGSFVNDVLRGTGPGTTSGDAGYTY